MKTQKFNIVTFVASALFISKLNFAVKTAKKLSIKRSDALAMADDIESKATEDTSLETFSKAFVAKATTFVADSMQAAIDKRVSDAAQKLEARNAEKTEVPAVIETI